MDRFIAFSWDRHATEQSACVERWCRIASSHSMSWSTVLDCPGFRVLAPAGDDARPILTHMPGADGIIIGALFRQGHERSGRVDTLDPSSIAAIVRTGPESLSRSHWGSFIVLRRNQQASALEVARDPCGSTPCFRLRSLGVHILCASLDDVADLPALSFSIDWTSVRAFLLHGYFITRHTGLNEVFEVLPGEHVTLHDDGRTTSASTWNPATLARTPRRCTFNEAQEELRAVAETCFAAWGATHQDIVVRMSGGLDSSIVANLIRRSSTGRVTGLHLAGRGYETSETALARLAAMHAGIDLVEVDAGPSIASLASLTEAPRLARPTKQILGAAADAALTTACAALGAGCVMTGHGGDSLFLQRSLSGDVFVDFVRLNGLGPGLWRQAYEAAILQQRPVWNVLGGAAAHVAGLRRWHPRRIVRDSEAVRNRLLSEQGIAGIPSSYFAHAWLDDPARLPPCKAEQVRGVIALRNYHPTFGHGVRYAAIQPLVSQPIVEFSLQTPAYLFSREGIDRALERCAFGNLIPEPVARRLQKGFVNHQLTHDVVANLGMLRRFLMEGHVVASGVVDRQSVVQLMSDASIAKSTSLGSVMALLAAEAWVAAWRRNAAPGA